MTDIWAHQENISLLFFSLKFHKRIIPEEKSSHSWHLYKYAVR